jgi:hypothetical protein
LIAGCCQRRWRYWINWRGSCQHRRRNCKVAQVPPIVPNIESEREDLITICSDYQLSCPSQVAL